MKVLTNFIYIFVALLPFQFALNIAPGFDLSVVRVVVLFLFGAIISKSFLKRDFFIPINLQSVCLILFLAISIFSIFFAKDMEFGLRKILFLLSILPLYFIVLDVYRDNLDKEFIFKLIRWIIWGGAMSFLIGIIIFSCQFVWGIDAILVFYQKIGPFFWGNTFAVSVFDHQSFLVNAGGRDFLRMSAFFPDPHNFSLFAGMICLLSLSMFLFYVERQTEKAKTIFYGLVFLLSALSVFLSFSRGAYLALFGGILLVVVLWLRIKNGEAVKKSMIESSKKSRYTTLLCLFFAAVLFMAFILSPVKNRFIDVFSFTDGSNVGRIQIMKDGLNIFKGHFLSGVGIGNAPLYYNEDADYRSPINSHNTYLEIAIENGLLGLLIWLVLIFGTIFSCARYFKKEKDRLSKYLSLGLAGSLLFFAIHSFFEVLLYSPINLSVLMILLAVSSIILNKDLSNQ